MNGKVENMFTELLISKPMPNSWVCFNHNISLTLEAPANKQTNSWDSDSSEYLVDDDDQEDDDDDDTETDEEPLPLAVKVLLEPYM